MKETKHLIHANIANLTSLWKTVGTSFDAYDKTSDFEFCEIKNSEWPNRIWLNQGITQETIEGIKEKLVATPSTITLPLWNIYDEDHSALLEANGFNLTFEQVGMSMAPTKTFTVEGDVRIERVTNETQAKLWSVLFEKSFGYAIGFEVVIRTYKEINYYIAYHGSSAVGTALLHHTHDVMGIHSVGIPPDMRRRGYAGEIMKLLLNIAVENRDKHIVLQASNMGKNLYVKLGFEEQFLIRNYVLPSP